MNQNSASGPDGYADHFYITFWKIKKEDVIKAIHSFL